MKRLFLLLCIAFVLQGCIEIKETITLNANGGGNIALLIDLGKIGKAINQQSGTNFLDQIKKVPLEANNLLKSSKGISNLQTKSDDEEGIYAISFDFKNTKSLNNAIYSLFNQKKLAVMPNFIKVSKHKLTRMNFAPLIKKYVAKDKGNMVSDMFYQYVNFESTYNFPTAVKKVSNSKAKLENDNKTVHLKYTLHDLLTTDFDYGISVKY